MKREEALQLSEQAISDLSESLKAGRSDTLENYLGMLARFHRYSFGNVVMIYLQFPTATHVAGYTTWKKLGRYVKPGEKGIAIFAPLLFKRKTDEDDSEPDSESKAAKVLRGFKVVHVFDVSQTEGKPLAEFAEISGDPGELLDQVKKVIEDEGIVLRYEEGLCGALGKSTGGEIAVLSNLAPAEEFTVLVHELAHELLHKGERRKETSKTVRETEAEAVAFVVSQAVGLDCSTRSSDYIQLYRGDAETLSESLDQIQRAATRILSALELPAAEKRQAVNC